MTELLLYEVHRGFGFAGLIVLFAAITAAAFFILYLRCDNRPYIAGAVTLIAAWATMPLWGVRPQIVSLLFTSLWLLLLERSEKSPRLLWWTVPLTVLWANLHAGFALGLALSAVFLIGDWLDTRRQGSPRHFGFAAMIFFLDLLIVPLNPNGWRLYVYPFETLRSAAMQNYIAEWASPNFHHPEYWPLLFLFLLTIAALLWSGPAIRSRDRLLLVLGLYATLHSVRLVPLFALLAAPVIAARLPVWRPTETSSRSAIHLVFSGATLLALVAFASAHAVQVMRQQAQAERQSFPADAVAYLQAHAIKGNLFNHYDWGGYLIWRLYPSLPVFIDGRADVYGAQLFDQFASTYQFKDDWRNTLERYQVGVVLIPKDSALATGLRNSFHWVIAYEDPRAVIFLALPTAVEARSRGLAYRSTGSTSRGKGKSS
ncbi:MAG TPA: hypothetical protein VND65_04705 [Candidatus Binatia bacterium]|nr:hypothetical protein [Candidatus Binatia bacterium]